MFSEQFQIFLKISRKKWTTLIAILHSLFVGHFVFVFHVPLCLLLNSNLSLYLYLQRLAEQGAIYYLRNSHRPDDRKTLMQYQLKSENLNHPKYCLFTLANATFSFFSSQFEKIQIPALSSTIILHPIASRDPWNFRGGTFCMWASV